MSQEANFAHITCSGGHYVIHLPLLASFLFVGLLTPAVQADSASFSVALETQAIVVADLFGDIKQQLENKAREIISKPADTGDSRAEQTPPSVSQNSYPAQVEAAPPQARPSKKPDNKAAVGQALPPLPVIERDKEIDLYAGKWRLLKPFPLYAKEGGGAVIKTLQKGQNLDGLSLAVHTLAYGVAELKRPLTRQFSGDHFNQVTQQRELSVIPLQRGDKIAYISYFGEGECRVWVKGRTYISSCFGAGLDDVGDAELERNAHYSGKIKTTHWAWVRTPDGSKGWLWIKDADFESIQGISKHGKSVGE